MGATTGYPHLGVDEKGCVRIEGTRYKVLHLAGEHYHYGWSADELLDQHSDLQPEQVYAALTYFYDHHEEMIREMQAEEERPPAPAPRTFSRSSLRARLAPQTPRP